MFPDSLITTHDRQSQQVNNISSIAKRSMDWFDRPTLHYLEDIPTTINTSPHGVVVFFLSWRFAIKIILHRCVHHN